jgi:hypothetical protein
VFALVAFAPIGSSYSAIKHFCLAFDFTANSCSAALVLVASFSAILAWLLQLRLFPAAFGISRHRAFAASVHEVFLPVLGFTVSLLLFLLTAPGSGIFDANSALSFSLLLFALSRFAFYSSDRLIGKLVLVVLDVPQSIFGFVYLVIARLSPSAF